LDDFLKIANLKPNKSNEILINYFLKINSGQSQHLENFFEKYLKIFFWNINKLDNFLKISRNKLKILITSRKISKLSKNNLKIEKKVNQNKILIISSKYKFFE